MGASTCRCQRNRVAEARILILGPEVELAHQTARGVIVEIVEQRRAARQVTGELHPLRHAVYLQNSFSACTQAVPTQAVNEPHALVGVRARAECVDVLSRRGRAPDRHGDTGRHETDLRVACWT